MIRRLRRTYHKALRLVGMVDGDRVFTGPHVVQLDLTNRCNNNCLACSVRSPLISETSETRLKMDAELPLDLVLATLDHLRRLGTVRIDLSGGGEPFLYPGILAVLRRIRHHGMECSITTNFTLVDEPMVGHLLEFGVDDLFVSLWAGTPEVYVRTHPNRQGSDFVRLRERLASLIRRRQRDRPRLSLVEVIFKENYRELPAMFEFACAVGADSITFRVMTPLPGITDRLLLSRDERLATIRSVQGLLATAARPHPVGRSRPAIYNADEFIRRLASPDQAAAKGDYDQAAVSAIPCYAGWMYFKVNADGRVNSCLKSYRTPVGDLHADSIRDLWYGDRQAWFRRSAARPDKSALVAEQILCHQTCDNHDSNRRLHRIVSSMSSHQRNALRAAGKLAVAVSRQPG